MSCNTIPVTDYPLFLIHVLGGEVLTLHHGQRIVANGGFRVKPWFISRVEDNRGGSLYAAKPETAGVDAERVLDERNAFLMTNLMRDVVRYGTAAKAMSLGRQDLAGKTGTTNDHIDAWFAGFNGRLAAIAWIGFDTPANQASIWSLVVPVLPARSWRPRDIALAAVP